MRVAIIGGIGCGKSEMLKVAREMGFFCESADEINAQLLLSPDYIEKLSLVFPTAVENGVVDKKKLASIVFSNDDERKKLNALAHPAIMQTIFERSQVQYVVEMPLILESGAKEFFDEIVLVKSNLVTRLFRLKKRGLGIFQALARMRVQPSQRQLEKIATFVVNNNKDRERFCKDSKCVFEKILNKY